jgi:hypothetical protein
VKYPFLLKFLCRAATPPLSALDSTLITDSKDLGASDALGGLSMYRDQFDIGLGDMIETCLELRSRHFVQNRDLRVVRGILNYMFRLRVDEDQIEKLCQDTNIE